MRLLTRSADGARPSGAALFLQGMLVGRCVVRWWPWGRFSGFYLVGRSGQILSGFWPS